MVNVEYVPGIPGKTDGVAISLTVSEAKRIRAALSEFVADELGSYGGILEIFRRSIPQQFGQ